MSTYKLKGVASQQYTNKEGVVYAADANGVVTLTSPWTYETICDLIDAGCIPLGQLGALNNYTATTNPGVGNDNTQDYGIGSHWLNKNTGVEYVATSVATGAAVWTALNAAGYAGLPLAHGNVFTGRAGTPEAVLTVLGTLYAFPIFIPNAVTLGSLSYSVTTGQTGGKVRGALFADNGAGYPGAIVAGSDTGDLTATGTAVETKSSLALALTPGWYWLGTIATASSTMPSVIGATPNYTNGLSELLGFDTAAHALATSGEAPTGYAITGQTYPATDMATSFPTFPASAALTLNAATPVAALTV